MHYGCMMLFHLATPYFAIVPSMAASVMRNRVLVPAHAWLYFLNLSRFSVDRRGHFRAVGETTTADLVTYKQKQRAAAEESKAKAVCSLLLLTTPFFAGCSVTYPEHLNTVHFLQHLDEKHALLCGNVSL